MVGRGFEKRVNSGPTLKFDCWPKGTGKTAFWKVAFLLSSLLPRKYSDNNFGQLPPFHPPGVRLGCRKNPRIIIGENSCHFDAAYNKANKHERIDSICCCCSMMLLLRPHRAKLLLLQQALLHLWHQLRIRNHSCTINPWVFCDLLSERV